MKAKCEHILEHAEAEQTSKYSSPEKMFDATLHFWDLKQNAVLQGCVVVWCCGGERERHEWGMGFSQFETESWIFFYAVVMFL